MTMKIKLLTIVLLILFSCSKEKQEESVFEEDNITIKIVNSAGVSCGFYWLDKNGDQQYSGVIDIDQYPEFSLPKNTRIGFAAKYFSISAFELDWTLIGLADIRPNQDIPEIITYKITGTADYLYLEILDELGKVMFSHTFHPTNPVDSTFIVPGDPNSDFLKIDDYTRFLNWPFNK